jgi:protein-S-isoprenylcysteine O-methyltransferase Ste14
MIQIPAHGSLKNFHKPGRKTMIKLGFFVIISVFLLVFTLFRSHQYRFYRFFAFESLLVLVILNSDQWFSNPFSSIQLVSWFFLFCSLVFAVNGFILLKMAGSPVKDIEDTTKLITTGAYRYIRHPLYGSLLLGGIGAFLKDPNIIGLFILLILFFFLISTAKVEERNNLQKFGTEYKKYMDKTKMFIPFLI